MTKPVLVVTGVVVVGLLGSFLVLSGEPQSSETGPYSSAVGNVQPFVEIAEPAGFINTSTDTSGNARAISLGELVGKKVILIDFLTYSCINCQRTFPHINAWYEKYKDQGLEIIGIHTPEFAFEKDINNVRAAMRQFGITHPIVLDNDYATWRAYGNQYWPRKYLIDIHGNIVYDHIGEGAYEETEMKIKELLMERARVLGETLSSMDTALASSAIPSGTNGAQSPETYFGSGRNEHLGNGTPGRAGTQSFVVPKTLEPNTLYLGGSWNITPEYAESNSPASVLYTYRAKEVYVVAESDSPTTLEVWQDGVRTHTIDIKESKLYTLVQSATASEHTLELRTSSKGVRFYAFTFG